MVASIDKMIQAVRSNPYIDGVGYFVEVTTEKPVPTDRLRDLTERMQQDFCAHSQVTQEGEHVLGLDFHEHLTTRGEDGGYYVSAIEALLKEIEHFWGIDHLCIEFQFDLRRARKARREVDELLQP